MSGSSSQGSSLTEATE